MSKKLTPEELETALATAKAENVELQKQSDADLKTAIAESVELKKQTVDLQKQVDSKKSTLQKTNDDLVADNNTLMDTIKDLKSKLASKTAQAKLATKEVTVDSGNKTYVVAIPNLNIKGEIVTAEDLVERADLVEHLLEIGSEALVEKK